jgi:hypothetical protein
VAVITCSLRSAQTLVQQAHGRAGLPADGLSHDNQRAHAHLQSLLMALRLQQSSCAAALTLKNLSCSRAAASGRLLGSFSRHLAMMLRMCCGGTGGSTNTDNTHI